MKLKFNLDNVFIPEWNKNKKLPTSEQIKITWRFPSYSERKEIKYFTNPVLQIGGKVVTDMELKMDMEKAVDICVTKIENLVVNEILIKDGTNMISTLGIGLLVDEIGAEIIHNMDKINNSKNS